MPDYTLLTLAAMIAVVLIEVLWLRTGVFTSRQYWISLAIVLAFQIPVDGYLTRLGAPVVIYAHDRTSGVRFPFDIPVEDFGFGFALVTLAIAWWVRLGRNAGTPTTAAEPSSTRSLR